MTDVLLIGLGLAGQWCLGIGLAIAIVGPRLLESSAGGARFLIARAELIGLGFVLGIAANSYLQFAWSLAGGLLGRGCSLVFAAGGIVFGLTVWIIRRRPPPDAAIPGENELAEGWVVARCLAVLLIALFLFAMIQALLTPQKFWDERAFYGLKAIVLFEDHSINSPDLKEPDFVQGHPRYPLMISLGEQHLYALLGRVDDRLSKVLFPVLYLGMVFTIAGVLMRHLPLNRAWLGAVLVATIPVLMPDDYGVICGQADAPVACLEGVALSYLWDALATRFSSLGNKATFRASLVIAALVTSFTAFTKDEGISHGAVHSFVFMVILACSLTVRSSKQIKGDWKDALIATLILILIPAVILGPWFIHRRQLPLTGEMNYFGRLSISAIWNGAPTLAWSVPHLAWRMFGEATTWGLQWWFVVMSVFLFPRRALRWPQLFLLLTLCGDIAALLLAGMIAPVMLQEHIGGSSHRYLMQLAPGALLLAFSNIAWHQPSRSIPYE